MWVHLGFLLLSLDAIGAGKPWCDPAINFTDSASMRNALGSVRPDPSTQWGTWDGWGVSLCWWANVFGDRNDIADVVFTMKESVSVEGVEGVTLPGLGLNIARYNAGGSAWKEVHSESMAVSPNIPHFKQIEGFWQDYNNQDPDSPSWNWSVDSKQVSMLQKAKQRGADTFELFSNSPMWWMLYNHNPSGNGNGAKDNLQWWNRNNHSVYLASIAAHAKDIWGIEFASVEPFNEPVTDWWKASGTQEGCHFDTSTQQEVVQELRKELKNRGLQTIVSASDENTYDYARSTWKSFDSDAKAVVDRVNVHGYQGTGGRRDLLYTDVAGKQLWNSEYGDGDGSGMSMATNLNLDFRWLHSTAYCYWQILDATGGWGLLRFDSSQFVVEAVNPKYWVLAQYTRHIRPGMTIMDSGGDDNTVVAYDAAWKKLVLVGLNTGDERTVTYDLSGFGRVDGPITRWSTKMASDGERYARYTDGFTFEAGMLNVKLTSHNIQTFEIENVHLQIVV